MPYFNKKNINRGLQIRKCQYFDQKKVPDTKALLQPGQYWKCIVYPKLISLWNKRDRTY